MRNSGREGCRGNDLIIFCEVKNRMTSCRDRRRIGSFKPNTEYFCRNDEQQIHTIFLLF